MRNQRLRMGTRPTLARSGVPARSVVQSSRVAGTPGSSATDKSLADVGAAAHSIVEWLAIVVPALSAVTALLFLFGWTYTNTRLGYFGIDHTILGFDTADYVLRSADAVFVPAAVVLFMILAALLLHAGLMGLAGRSVGLRALRVGGTVAIIGGLLATAVGVWAMFLPVPFISTYLVAPALQGGGLTLGAYGFRLLQRLRNESPRPVPRWERRCYWVVALVVVLNLFWASSQFASALGSVRARDLERDLANRPAVTVFSKHDLAIGGPVLQSRIALQESAYSYKYTGLRLIIRSAGKYVMLSEGWSRGSGTAVVLDEGPDIRLEFSPGGVEAK